MTRARVTRAALIFAAFAAYSLLVPTSPGASAFPRAGSYRGPLRDERGRVLAVVVHEVTSDRFGYPSTSLELERTRTTGFDPKAWAAGRRQPIAVDPARLRDHCQEEGSVWAPEGRLRLRPWALPMNLGAAAVLAGVTIAWHLRLLGWRPSATWPRAVARVVGYAMVPLVVMSLSVAPIDGLLRGAEVPGLSRTPLAIGSTMLGVAVLLVLAHTRGKLVEPSA